MARTLWKVMGPLLSLLLGCWLLAGSALAAESAAPAARMTATVVEFQVRGGLDEQSGAIIADLMMSAIANTDRFVLRDRVPLSAAAKIAKAQELGETGWLDPKTAAELGRLYGLDAVVTGGVYKLGDLITVTARLIDTRTASLLRSGQIQGKDIDTIQIKINELAAMITTPPEPSKTYALTVTTDPADASVRVLNHPTPYRPGMQLIPGEYEIEVMRAGYVPRQGKVQLGQHDATVTIALEKARYGLTVQTQPADAQVRLLNSAIAYQPGVALLPGDYEIEVTREGYAPRKLPVRIVDGKVALAVTLEKAAPPPPTQYRLTVLPEPPQATVRLLNAPSSYQAGMLLPPGEYQLEIALEGYETQRLPVRIAQSDVTLPVALKKSAQPTTYRLTVQPEPASAQVRLVDASVAYQPGVRLAPGSYTVEVTQVGYEPAWITAQLSNNDVTIPVKLSRKAEEPPKTVAYRLTVQPDPARAQVRLLGTKVVYKPGIELPPGAYTIEVSQAGHETRRVPIQIANSDLTVPVTLVKQVEPPQYRLTVRPEPPDARVRLLGTKATYQPGIALPAGSYTVEVSQRGYQTQKVTARMVDSDNTLSVTLIKETEPTLYRLTVQTEPPGAQVRLRGTRSAYRAGVLLAPGAYTVEVSQSGYESQRVTARITDRDATLSVALVKEPEPTLYRLTVQTEPPGAQVRLRGTRSAYRPGVLLAPGAYTVEVSQSGYESQRVTARITDRDATLSVTLVKEAEPERYQLTVRADPQGARIRLVNSAFFYRPGVELPSGKYVVEVAETGYETKRVPVQISDRDVMLPVELERIATVVPPARKSAPDPIPAPAATASRPGEWRVSNVSADGSIGGTDRTEFMRIFGGYVGRTVTRDTLLDGALRFYQSTGITLGFSVQVSGSGADVSGRVARRFRRTHESTVPILTRSQFSSSGFSVSVQ